MVSIQLTGKTAVVTGGAGGLGKAIAIKLAEAGSNVVISDINYEGAVQVAYQIKQMGVKSRAVKSDVTQESEIFKLVELTVKEFGSIDIMINNAGIGMMKPINAFTTDEIERIINIDLKGVIYGCRAALKYMVEQKSGKIVNISSVAAKLGTPNASIYAAAKNGVIALTNSLAREVAEANININAVCPGIIRTDMWENELKAMTNNGSQEIRDQVFEDFSNSQIPLKRPQESEDIANMTIFLCSDLAKNITAQTINVDGGISIF